MEISPIQIVDYCSDWPLDFQKEKSRLVERISEWVAHLHHIGSTSIPQMAAKPVIDLLLELKDLRSIEKLDQELQILGYAPLRRSMIRGRTFFTSTKGSSVQFHLHVLERGDPEAARHLLFRDYIIAHPRAGLEYGELKRNLAKKYQNDRLHYTLAKSEFVQNIDRLARTWAPTHLKLDCFPHDVKRNLSLAPKSEIVKAIEVNFHFHTTFFPLFMKGVEVIRVPGLTTVNSGLNDDTFNCVVDTDLSDEEADERISSTITHFHQKKLPFSWWVGPTDQPSDLAKRLKRAGLIHSEDHIGMSLDLTSWSASSDLPQIEIRRALDRDTLRDFAAVLTNGNPDFLTYFEQLSNLPLQENDPIEFYVGYVQGKPVTRGLIVFYAGVAGFHYLSTDPKFRKKGYAAALHQFRFQRAKNLGYTVASVLASPQAVSLDRKQGFLDQCIFREFKPQALF